MNYVVCELLLSKTVRGKGSMRCAPEEEMPGGREACGDTAQLGVLTAPELPLQRVLHGEVRHEQLLRHRPGREDIPGLQQQA